MSSDQLYREVEALREHLSRLSAAGPRINESLDLDTMQRTVMDSARRSESCLNALQLRGWCECGRHIAIWRSIAGL